MGSEPSRRNFRSCRRWRGRRCSGTSGSGRASMSASNCPRGSGLAPSIALMRRTPSTTSRAKALERKPFKSVRPVSRDIFRGRIQVVRERTARGLRARSPARYRRCVGGATDRRARYGPRGPLFPGGIAIRQRPSAVWIIAILIRAAGSLDHAVQRDMFDDFELSHSEPLANPNAINQFNCSELLR